MLHLLLTSVLLLVSPHLTSSAPAGDEFISLVEEAAKKIPEASVKDDQILNQEIRDGHTIYRHVSAEKHGAPVFVRKGSDEGKPVVVLAQGEDYLPVCDKKKTFVVLKQFGDDKKEYRVFFAYVRTSKQNQIEWDNWCPRGNLRNKAPAFGFIRCSKTNMAPCKKELQIVAEDSPDYEDLHGVDVAKSPNLPYVYPPPHVHSTGGSDYYCDLSEGDALETRFTGAVISAMTQSVVVLSGADLVYNDQQKMIEDVKEQIKTVASQTIKRGRGMGGPNIKKLTEEAAVGVVEKGKTSVLSGALMFYGAVVRVGALAIGETPLDEVPNLSEAKQDELTPEYKQVGTTVFRGLFRGVDFEDAEQKLTNPNPHKLMDEKVVETLVAGRSINEEEHAKQEGRGLLGWILGKADIGTSSSNGEQAIRQYKGVQRDGSVTGMKVIDNMNYAIDNAFGGSKKSAGQIFSENLVAGVYTPLGAIEDIGDALGGSILGIGKISDDRSYIDDLLDKALNVIAGAGGQIVDVVGDIIAPLGFGGIWNGIAGSAAGIIGFVGSAIASPVMGVYNLIKMGAKALNIGGIIGMQGSGSRENLGGNQNINRKAARPVEEVLAPQVQPAYVQAPPMAYPPPAYPDPYAAAYGRKKRHLSNPNIKDLDIGAVTDVDLFSHIGWKTIDVTQGSLENATYNTEVPFIGFGNCIYKQPTLQQFEEGKSPKAIAKLYMQSLRVNCLQDQVEIVGDLFSKGYLALEADKSFTVPASLAALTQAKLSVEEIQFLSKAFEISIYSKVYLANQRTPKPSAPWTKSVYTLKQMSLQFLEEAEKLAPLHYVKLSRNLAKLLKMALTKTLQDFFRFKHCLKCNKNDMMESLNDSSLLATLLEFVLTGQEKSEYSTGSKIDAFDQFFDASREAVSAKMSLYFL